MFDQPFTGTAQHHKTGYTAVTTTLDDHFLPRDIAAEIARQRAETTRAVIRAIGAPFRRLFAPKRPCVPTGTIPQAV